METPDEQREAAMASDDEQKGQDAASLPGEEAAETVPDAEESPAKPVDDPDLPEDGDPEDFDEEPVEEGEFEDFEEAGEEEEEPNDLSGIDKEFDDEEDD